MGVKNGVDFDSRACGCQKNRVGSFYAPSAALLDKSFIRTQVRTEGRDPVGLWLGWVGAYRALQAGKQAN